MITVTTYGSEISDTHKTKIKTNETDEYEIYIAPREGHPDKIFFSVTNFTKGKTCSIQIKPEELLEIVKALKINGAQCTNS